MLSQQELCTHCGKPLSPFWTKRCEHCKTPMEVAKPRRAFVPGEGEVVVRTYPGDSHDQAIALFTEDAAALARQGYEVVSQSWASYQASAAERAMWVDRPSAGYLSVTYRLRSAPPQSPALRTLTDRLRELDDARRSGLLTEAEYADKRARLLAEH